MSTPKQQPGETDRHYFDRCRTEKEVSGCRCRKCGADYESDGENDNGLCFECDSRSEARVKCDADWTVGGKMLDGSISVEDSGPECPCIVALVQPNSVDGEDRQEQNARLIASAPKMLEALRQYYAAHNSTGGRRCECRTCDTAREAFKQANRKE